ncbi:hypothetical protein LP420_40205 [Massilia sp. B-10]|nr:hypothetical protein LP420_40205 [Massilia sp. B-10]
MTIGATGDLAVSATRSTDVIGQGISTATNTDADTGVAAAISLNIALLHNDASVGDNASLTADSVAVEAVMNAYEVNTFQNRALSGAASKKTAIGGSISINYIENETHALVGTGVTLHATMR